MTLWERIERWRATDKPFGKSYSDTGTVLYGAEVYKQCAAELEADLRELQQRIKQAFPAMSDDICKMILGEKEP